MDTPYAYDEKKGGNFTLVEDRETLEEIVVGIILWRGVAWLGLA
jgi:hypothetical protein